MSESKKNNTKKGPGDKLRAAREQAKLSPDDIASRLRLSPKIIQALEDNNFNETVVSSAYIRGYLRAYAREVRLGADEVVSAYEAMIQIEEPAVIPQSESVRGQAQTAQAATAGSAGKTVNINLSKNIKPYLWAMGFVAVLLLSWYVFRQPKAEVIAEDTASELNATIQSGDALEAANEQQNQAVETEQQQAQQQVQSKPKSATRSVPSAAVKNKASANQPAATKPTTSSNTQALYGQSKLRLSFTDDCWVTIRDASDQRLAAGLMSSGKNLEVTGKPPFNITLGNAAAAKVWIDGKAVDLGPYAKQRVARMLIGAADG